jgi:hypothetical protein
MVGRLEIVTVTASWQPTASVILRVYVPGAVPLIVAEVPRPLLHWYE